MALSAAEYELDVPASCLGELAGTTARRPRVVVGFTPLPMLVDGKLVIRAEIRPNVRREVGAAVRAWMKDRARINRQVLNMKRSIGKTELPVVKFECRTAAALAGF